MTTKLLVAFLIIAVRFTGFSQESTTNQTAKSELNGAVYSIDVTNKTIQVCPWDQTAKTFRRDSIRVFTWKDETVIVWAHDTLTMGQFIAGKQLNDADMFGHPRKPIEGTAGIRGVRFTFQLEQDGSKTVVRRMSGALLFAGESIAGQVGSRSVSIPSSGDGKVHFDDNK